LVSQFQPFYKVQEIEGWHGDDRALGSFALLAPAAFAPFQSGLAEVPEFRQLRSGSLTLFFGAGEQSALRRYKVVPSMLAESTGARCLLHRGGVVLKVDMADRFLAILPGQ
jgi:hypothetical protein